MRRLAFLLALSPVAATAQLPVEKADVVREYPHDRDAFTEGLFYDNGVLWESTGYVGKSSIRKVALTTGKVLARVTVPPPYFGEGIAPWAGQIVSLTWQQGQGFRWSKAGLRKIGEVRYTGEGWGMTNDGKDLVMSDGTPVIRFLDPATFTVRRTITVTAQGKPVKNVNELEWVDGEILANIWMTDAIVRIDPHTGVVKGVLDVSALHAKVGTANPDAVANGIAWDAARRRLFVTGKNWPTLFELRWPKH